MALLEHENARLLGGVEEGVFWELNRREQVTFVEDPSLNGPSSKWVVG
jgi:hypothetical protein